MKAKGKRNLSTVIYGLLIGTVNGLLGSGGGIVAVLALKRMGFDQKSAQQNAVAIILPITVFSAALYLMRGNVMLSDALPYIPTGILGAIIGSFIIKKISPKVLRVAFGIFMVYAGIRLLMR
ncbi:MAG: sulfite exporter TauE/SafE family protein [Ruminococcaceae bacterium]|nr:sulfite exporter TauE/SafE family protein [Oscillospiraceae bacterium]